MGRVLAVDVQRRVGLGVAELLGLLQGLIEVHALRGHFRENIVARAVEYAQHAADAVAGERAAQGLDDGHGAGHAGLVAQDQVLFAGETHELGAFHGQKGLVGRDHVLAVLKGPGHERERRVDTAHELHEHIDIRIIGQIGGIRRNPAAFGQLHGAGLVHVAHEHALQLYAAACPPAHERRVFLKKFSQAASDRSEAGQPHTQGRIKTVRHLWASFSLMLAVCPAARAALRCGRVPAKNTERVPLPLRRLRGIPAGGGAHAPDSSFLTAEGPSVHFRPPARDCALKPSRAIACRNTRKQENTWKII